MQYNMLNLWLKVNQFAGVKHVAQHPATLLQAGKHHLDPNIPWQGTTNAMQYI